MMDRGIANPIAMILSAAMMLGWLGDRRADSVARSAEERIESAVARVLSAGTARTPDLGGRATTAEIGDAVAAALEEGR